MSRHKARVLAFQALYAWDAGCTSQDDLLAFSWLEDEKKDKLQTKRSSAPSPTPAVAPVVSSTNPVASAVVSSATPVVFVATKVIQDTQQISPPSPITVQTTQTTQTTQRAFDKNKDNKNDNSQDYEKDHNKTLTFARLLFCGTIENINQVDKVIKKHLKANWDFKRIDRVCLAVLRLSVYELLFQKQLDAPIVIDEAVRIAKKYGKEDAYNFVNGILDKIKDTFEKTTTS